MKHLVWAERKSKQMFMLDLHRLSSSRCSFTSTSFGLSLRFDDDRLTPRQQQQQTSLLLVRILWCPDSKMRFRGRPLRRPDARLVQ
jgi:hypothetical protein